MEGVKLGTADWRIMQKYWTPSTLWADVFWCWNEIEMEKKNKNTQPPNAEFLLTGSLMTERVFFFLLCSPAEWCSCYSSTLPLQSCIRVDFSFSDSISFIVLTQFSFQMFYLIEHVYWTMENSIWNTTYAGSLQHNVSSVGDQNIWSIYPMHRNTRARITDISIR